MKTHCEKPLAYQSPPCGYRGMQCKDCQIVDLRSALQGLYDRAVRELADPEDVPEILRADDVLEATTDNGREA